MKLETTKGEFSGTATECVEWLKEINPSHASVRIGEYVAAIDTDEPDWSKGLRIALVEMTDDAGINGGEDQWQQYLTPDQLAERVIAEG